MNKETRTLNIELRDDENRTIEGRAVVFNSQSKDMGFTEMIDPEAITEETVLDSDIFMLYNHNVDRGYLARSNKGKGSLHIDIREDGVYFNFIAPQTALADEVRAHMKAGDLDKCSFAFTVKEDTWKKKDDGTYFRTIKKIDRLYDFSLVDSPAYEATSCKCARFDEILAEEKAEVERKMKEAEEAKAKEEMEKAEAEEKEKEQHLSEYYSKLEDEVKNI